MVIIVMGKKSTYRKNILILMYKYLYISAIFKLIEGKKVSKKKSEEVVTQFMGIQKELFDYKYGHLVTNVTKS